MSLSSQKLHLRPANDQDCQLLWEWVNDPEVRKASFSSEIIPWETHKTWFLNKLENPNSFIFIAIDEHENPVGQIRFDLREDNNAEIDISIAPTERGQGYGFIVLKQGLETLFNQTKIETVTAWIKAKNLSSQQIFQKAGFIEINQNRKGNFAYQYRK